MIFSEDRFRPTPQYPIYPPYHQGDYLEDYFYNRFATENPITKRDYIGISWTTLYCDNKRNGLQDYLHSLPRDGKYFTVSQHDDAPSEILPPDTICFSAGGNIQGNNIVPIPLVCSKLLIDVPENMPRKLLASFVGSATHPIRIKMYESCKNMNDIIINMKGWTPTVSQNEFETFVNLTANSKFCLCPRGYGLNSFRLYEAMQLGSIPVIISDNHYLPWKEEIDWGGFAIILHEAQIPFIDKILETYTDKNIENRRNIMKSLIQSHFSLSGLYNNIIKRIQ